MVVKMTEREVLTVEEAADYLRTSPRTLQRWRDRRWGPRFSKIGGGVRYRRTDLDAFIEKHAHSPERK